MLCCKLLRLICIHVDFFVCFFFKSAVCRGGGGGGRGQANAWEAEREQAERLPCTASKGMGGGGGAPTMHCKQAREDAPTAGTPIPWQPQCFAGCINCNTNITEQRLFVKKMPCLAKGGRHREKPRWFEAFRRGQT